MTAEEEGESRSPEGQTPEGKGSSKLVLIAAAVVVVAGVLAALFFRPTESAAPSASGPATGQEMSPADRARLPSPEAMKSLFGLHAGEDGLLSADEAGELVSMECPPATCSEGFAERMMKSYDKDGDGSLDREEYDAFALDVASGKRL